MVTQREKGIANSILNNTIAVMKNCTVSATVFGSGWSGVLQEQISNLVIKKNDRKGCSSHPDSSRSSAASQSSLYSCINLRMSGT